MRSEQRQQRRRCAMPTHAIEGIAEEQENRQARAVNVAREARAGACCAPRLERGGYE